MTWQPISTAPDDTLVMTKIDDSQGMRNQQPLIRHGHLWFIDGSDMYVYYIPTHWQPYYPQ